jgi:drug/metabolite transporter (DMT)-like permease
LLSWQIFSDMELSFAGVLFSMLTGLTLACFYMLNKKAARVGKPLLVIGWVFICHIPVFLLWACLNQPLHVRPGYFVPGTAVMALSVAGNVLSIRALSQSPFSMMMPILGLSPVFAALLGVPLLHEWPSTIQWIGIVMAVLGVLTLYAPPERPWDIVSFWSGFMRERGAIGMAAAALTWAMSAPMDRLALRLADPQFHALYVFTGVVIALLSWLLLSGGLPTTPIPKRFWPLLLVTGALGGLSYTLQLTALQTMPAGPFEAIKRVASQLLALVFGAALFGEKMTRPKMAGIAILCIGVPLIVL